MGAQILVTGQVQTTALVNLRQGSPSTTALVLRKAQAGTSLAVTAIVAGEAVQGNPLWYMTAEQAYVWSGGCSAFTPGPAAPAVVPETQVPAAAAHFPLAVPLVVDLYHGDTVTSFSQAFTAGVRGIIHKATTGGSGRDDLYDDRRTRAVAAGMLWGAYHWGTAAPARQQVDNFMAVADPDENTLVALDYERTNGNQMTLDIAREFLTLIEERLGRKAVIYSGELAKADLGNRVDPFFGEHRLWLAQYGPTAVVQRSWSTYWLWQYAEKVANIPGLPGNSAGALDLDHFNGTAAQLAEQWAG
jgi:GH25 family lysozyme M1 (1,4-beta-N-acetylmuramidase)